MAFSVCSGTGDCVPLPVEPLKGLPWRLSRSLGDGGSDVTFCNARPARTIGDSIGREALDRAAGLSILAWAVTVGGGGCRGEEAVARGVSEDWRLVCALYGSLFAPRAAKTGGEDVIV